MILPSKLFSGSGVRIIAPSCTLPSMPWFSDEMLTKAKKFFIDRGMTVTEGKYLREIDEWGSTSIEHRLEDLHEGFRDPTVHALITMRGGWNVNQLLPYIDYDLIKRNPKILCGLSDITALTNALYAKTGLVTYSGPNFNQFAYGEKIRYTHEHFEQAIMWDGLVRLTSSEEWTDDFYSPTKPWEFWKNEGWWVVNEGVAEGVSIGGNLCTLNLLQGTEYMPDLSGSILFIEDDHETHPRIFDRNFISLTQQKGFDRVKGIIIGRLQTHAVHSEFGPVTKEQLFTIIGRVPGLHSIPVIANTDFGHTHPIFTFPIGGTVRMVAGKRSYIEILKH